MCAEFTPAQPLELEHLFKAAKIIKKVIHDEFNFRVFPRSTAPIIRKNKDGGLELIEAEFSLIPSWWDPNTAEKKTKTGRPVFATHNARLESIDEKPTFKDSFKNRHCLIPIAEFFESSLFGNKFAGNRVKISSGGTLLAAGCYSEWIDQSTGEIIISFTIITHLANKTIFESGHDRMPVFLNRKAGMEWFDNQGKSLSELKMFLLKNKLTEDLELEVKIDRTLKEGWQKSAPGDDEIRDLEKYLTGY